MAFKHIFITLIFVVFAGCSSENQKSESSKAVISSAGSDTMVNLTQMWAEEYRNIAPNISIEVGGGGSGVGIRDLMHGVILIANCSRHMDKTEKKQAQRNTGKTPVEWIVAYDALAVYVHKENPLDSISFEQLRGIYEEHGEIKKWSQLGVDMRTIGAHEEILRISRQNSSGTYVYFRDKVLNQMDFKLGSLDMSGSKDVVAIVGRSPSAIGYSGMGYVSDGVKFLKIAVSNDDIAHELTLEKVLAGKYPLARPLMLYTLGQPEGHVKDYIDWILSSAGQNIVKRAGYIPLNHH